MQRAVVRVLAAANDPMQVTGIHLAVECLLGRFVSKESVSYCLRKGAQGVEPRFERVSLGRYRFRCQ